MVYFSGGNPNAGRKVVTEQENRTWSQRIAKEESINAKVKPGNFQIRSAIKVADVPADFKIGYDRPQKGFQDGERGFEEFRRSINERTAGPRELRAYPETMQQQHGWLLATTLGAGKRVGEAERLRVQPLCMGHGWLPNLSPEDALAASAGAAEARSVVSAAPPSALSAAAPASVVSAAGPEVVSQLSVAPPARSALSASAPALRSALSAAAPSGLAGRSALAPTAPPAAASCVAPAAPLRGGHPASQLSAASSLPALREGGDARALLQRREAKLGRLVERSRAYLKNGERGEAWFKGRPRTDATYFQEHFARNNGGLPPHKVRGARDFAKPSIP